MGNLDGYSSWTEHPSFFYHASLALVLALRQHIPASQSTLELISVVLPPLLFVLLRTLAHTGIRAVGHRTLLGFRIWAACRATLSSVVR